jgi:hypothetical protein
MRFTEAQPETLKREIAHRLVPNDRGPGAAPAGRAPANQISVRLPPAALHCLAVNSLKP